MEHPDSTETDESMTGTDHTQIPGSALTWWPSTAIERQQAAASARAHERQAQQKATDDMAAQRTVESTDNFRRPKRAGAGIYIVLFLFIAVAAAWVLFELNRPLQEAGYASWQRLKAAVAYSVNSATHSSPPIGAALPTPPPPPVTHSPIANNSVPTNAVPTAAPKTVETTPHSDAITIPMADVSLRDRPELLEQLVQIYQSQLAHNANDATALAVLRQLQERSLSELETIIVQGDDSVTVKALAALSRIFPDLAENTRYKYLIARMDFAHRETKTEPPAKSDSSSSSATATNSPTATSPTTMPSATISAATHSSPKKIMHAQTVASPADTSISVKKTTANMASSKPKIHVISMTPGAMVENRFVPSADGNVFIVEISYRNFDDAAEDPSEAELVARLGVPGDPMVLAEAPIDIYGDRGTKSFIMETLVPGNTGGKYQLNFILNGEFLTSSTIRLSRPER